MLTPRANRRHSILDVARKGTLSHLAAFPGLEENTPVMNAFFASSALWQFPPHFPF
jgi:hypothetical protein